MTYLLLKSLHLVSMVAWFGGLLYLVRLFVYHAEAFDKPNNFPLWKRDYSELFVDQECY